MKNIFITGISSGIGNAATRFLINRGYKIYGSVRKEADAKILKEEFPELGVFIFDVTDKDAIKKAVDQLTQKLQGSGLDVLINNAGYAQPGPQSLISDDDFKYQLEVNLFGVRYVTNAFLPLLGTDKNICPNPGKIINISSVSGLFNTPFMGTYCISKHALESMSEVYRRELMLYGIDVVSINPGPIQSKIWDKNIGGLDRFKDSDYKTAVVKADKFIELSKSEALPAEQLAKLIHKTIENPKAPTNQIIHPRPWEFKLMRFLPKRMVDKIIYKRMMDPNSGKIR